MTAPSAIDIEVTGTIGESFRVPMYKLHVPAADVPHLGTLLAQLASLIEEAFEGATIFGVLETKLTPDSSGALRQRHPNEFPGGV